MSSKDIIRKLPSIESGQSGNLEKIDFTHRVLLQEKVDGSQLTIFKKDDRLHWYNKNSPCNPNGEPWRDAYLQLCQRLDFFQEGYFYHGESLKNAIKKRGDQTLYRPNVCEYTRLPRYNFIIYEIVRVDGYILTPEEMLNHLEGTGLETVQVFFDSSIHPYDQGMKKIIDTLLEQMENGTVQSSLGLKPEGVVLKVLNKQKDGVYSTKRLKFVRPMFVETHLKKKENLQQVSDVEFINELGKIYDTHARKMKAVQHLKEKGTWNNDLNKNYKNITDELNADLLKEKSDEIRDLLFVRFWPQISKMAQGDITMFFNSLQEEDK
jgi:hypothetical protein